MLLPQPVLPLVMVVPPVTFSVAVCEPSCGICSIADRHSQ